MVKVYQCKVFDEVRGQWVVEPGWRTKERIYEIARAEIIPGTELEVDPSQLDAFQTYNPEGDK